MSMSLRDQLQQAGLLSQKQLKQAAREEQQRRKKPGTSPSAAEQARLQAREAAAAKLARDQELNRKQRDKAEHAARRAQIRQLIEQNALPKADVDDYYNFLDGKRIRRIPVTAEQRQRLVAGELDIARCDGRYSLVPAAVAAKLRERDERSVMARPAAETPADENDPYKDFVVPDDLMW